MSAVVGTEDRAFETRTSWSFQVVSLEEKRQKEPWTRSCETQIQTSSDYWLPDPKTSLSVSEL